MTLATHRTLWRREFVAALNVLAQAAARLPLGALDPVLSGASAVELYTGGLWSTRVVELLCADARPLMIELFVTGFRWARRPGNARRLLWHPELQVGVDLAERYELLGVAEQANGLAVDINLGSTWQAESRPLSLKVIGVEDLIVRQVGEWLRDGAVRGEAAGKLQALVGLAGEGVCGPLRTGYLQSRLAWETDGEVVFDSLPVDEAGEPARRLRRTSLTQMQSVICVWRHRSGLSMVPRSWRGEFHKDGVLPRGVRNQNHSREGGWCPSSENVIALDDALTLLSD
jgi:hypothetical protein